MLCSRIRRYTLKQRMNLIERRQLIVGVVVTLALLAAMGILFFIRHNGAGGEYILVCNWVERRGLQAGAPVVMDGSVIGTVEMVSENPSALGIAVRMSVFKDAFGAIGLGSEAWIDASNSANPTVVIKPTAPDKSGRFLKIKPIIGVEKKWTKE